MMKRQFILFARYNRWANRRLYAAAATLAPERLWQETGAFFGSVMGTLNHILVADRIWLARFRGEAVPPSALDSVLFRDLPELAAARGLEDEGIIAFAEGLDEAALAGDVSYRTSKGIATTTPMAATLSHFFNHHAHHRGQAHVLIGQLGGVMPELDLIYYVRRPDAP